MSAEFDLIEGGGEQMSREEALDVRITHWEGHLADLELARRLAIGQLAALYAIKQQDNA